MLISPMNNKVKYWIELIDVLEPLNIEARYPSYKETLMKALTESYCEEIIKQTNELRIWIKSKL